MLALPRLLLTCGLCAALGSPARASVDIDLLAWFPDLKGSVRQSAGLADTVDFATDLGIRNRNFPELRARWQWGRRSSLRLGYTNWSYAGDNVLTRTFTYDGTAYVLGDRVLSSLNVNLLNLGYHWEPLQWKQVQVGLLFNVTTAFGDATLNVPARGIAERQSALLPLPNPGVTIHLTPSKILDLYAEAAGISAGKYGHLYNLEAGVSLNPDQYLRVTAVYRLFQLKAKDDPDFVNFRMSGPMFGIGWQF
ncbi:MAG: hypothetical protein IT204_24620 [Fimbriimonadaceae bacterium]|nr:hypothetical protein [Fimbriimonadaceae bacterium]